MESQVEKNVIFLYERIDRTSKDLLHLVRAKGSLKTINSGLHDLSQEVEELAALYQLTDNR